MNKAIYIHGLGGSGNGSSARNVKKLLEGEYEFSASTYNLLNPEQAFSQIQNDVRNADFIVASSLGAFYAASVNVCTPILLLNPCLEPENTIKNILYPEQRKDFDEEKCHREWIKIKEGWNLIDHESCGSRFAVFSDNDELFSFRDVFKKNFGTFYGTENSCMIHGTHEIAKDEKCLSESLSLFKKYVDVADRIAGNQSAGGFGGFDEFDGFLP